MNQLLHKLNQAIEESSDDLKQALKPVDPAELKAAETSMFEIIRQFKSGPNQSKFDTLELYYLADGILWDFKFRGDNKKYRVIMKELRDAKVDPNMKKLAQDATPIGEAGEDKPVAGDVVEFDDGKWEVVSWQAGVLKLKPMFQSNKSSKTLVGKDFYFEWDEDNKVWHLTEK